MVANSQDFALIEYSPSFFLSVEFAIFLRVFVVESLKAVLDRGLAGDAKDL